jgi:hypothetical protein
MFEQEVRPLRIAVLGYTLKLSISGLEQIVKNNKDNVLRHVRSGFDSYAIFNDGTRIQAITYGENMRDYKFDQLILFDDKRWLIMKTKCEDIQRLKEMTMYMSCVPEEYKILLYEDVDRFDR